MDSKTALQVLAEFWTRFENNEPDQPPLHFAVAVNELSRLLETSKHFFGTALIDEESLYLCTTKIRRYFSHVLGDAGNHQLDELESLVENSKVHAMGRALINIADFGQALEALRQSVGDAKALPQTPGENAQADEIIRIAQMQAQNIVEQAHQEAQRIVENAKRQK